ncbi:MAG: response regulator [Proteobacteria bacterium]|nr:response regulator [Pseudomonadota bacterium]
MKLRTQLFSGYIVVFVIMVLLAGMVFWSTSTILESQDQVERTYEVITKARLIQKLVVDMETGKRGFLLTGKDKFLEPYEQGKADYDMTMGELRDLLANAPEQLARLQAVGRSLERWQRESAAPEIQARRDVVNGVPGAGMGKVIALLEQETGDRIIRSIRDDLSKLMEIEKGRLKEYDKEATRASARSVWIVFFGTALSIGFGIVAALFISRATMRLVGGEPAAIAGIAEQIARGNLEVEIGSGVEEATGIRAAIVAMLGALRENRDRTAREDWLKTGIARLDETMRGDPGIEDLASRVISEVCAYLEAQLGALYLMQNGTTPALRLVSSYAYTQRKNLSNVFQPGEGLVGQAALEKKQILIRNVPEDYVRVTSGLGEGVPRFLCVTPFMHEGRLKGVVEIGALGDMTDAELEYLDRAMPALAVAIESAASRTHLARSLEESQRLSTELQAQQEELQTANEELEEQAQRLEESAERLQAQQEELRVMNEELEEKNDLLERQKKDVELARKDIAKKAEELALASKYKSEFLANMSHELRSPLNSLLLLAQGLIQNQEGNLTGDQVRSAEIIHGSGRDLLNLIDEILDLSKIEAGRMDIHSGVLSVTDLAEGLRASFSHLAVEKGIGLDVSVDEKAPRKIESDRKRVEQVLRNLVSNAIKFTETGSVSIRFGRPAAGIRLSRSGLAEGDCLAVAVRDTGIGIEPEKQGIIFEAFQQADGGTSRKYGGTGLGLSISRELARLLGGEIQLESQPGQGSTFTLYLPARAAGAAVPDGTPARGFPGAAASFPPPSGLKNPAVQIEDDRENLDGADRVILVIEDDPEFARILYKKCHERGLKCLVAPTGEAGLELAAKHLPGAVILDIRLPGMDGWSVLNALKEDVRTRHIPVHVASVEEPSTDGLRQGALGHATKPLSLEDIQQIFGKLEQVMTGKPRRVLVVEDDPEIRRQTVELIGDKDVLTDEARNGVQALEALRSGGYDCMVLDLGLPDMSGGELLEKAEQEGLKLPPVVVHTARDLTRDEELELREYAGSIVIKDVRSQERLLDEVSLFLHRVVSQMPEQKRRMIRDLHDVDAILRDRKVLVVDDDMRTTFAVSKLLTARGLKALKAENGERALRLLDQEPDVDLVLMDVMMPVMDGYETMKRIRAQDRFEKLPIIALTAKAMPEDREKCLAAGASDYLPKPVDDGRLFSMMRVWLSR